MIVSRNVKWVSSLDLDNYEILHKLSTKLKDFYTNNYIYYSKINFTENVWDNPEKLEQQDVLKELKTSGRILEVGCGRANILKSNIIPENNYTGLEFSDEIIELNSKNYPEATFLKFENPYNFPLEDNSYDSVFSHFVIEHTIFPNKFLDEKIRVLKKNGILIILCPDFLGRGVMSSQRSGFSQGTGREKLREGKIVDAFITGLDNRIKIPLYTSFLRTKARKSPRFYINLQPTVFEDDFTPDVDAVYLTYKPEIINYTKNNIKWLNNGEELDTYSRQSGHIYLKGIKV